MRILIDIGHPAHVHYFKNFIFIMQAKGHEFMLVARDKEVSHQLLDNLELSYLSRGKGAKSLIGKLFYIIEADGKILKIARKFKPDLFMSFASPYAAHVAYLMGKPHIVFDDTEAAKLNLILYPPFSSTILNPSVYWKYHSKKQLFFKGFMELCYLHPNYFQPDADIISSYGIDVNSPFVLVRFVSWDANHDIGQSGLSSKIKKELVQLLSKKARVLISAEGQLTNDLESYRIKIKPIHLHHFLAFSSLYVGEGATTASESLTLGTPAIYINTLNAGTIQDQTDNYGLISLRNSDNLLDIALSMLTPEAQKEAQASRDRLIEDHIDVTAFMVWFIENYPQSETILRDTPDYQYQFK